MGCCEPSDSSTNCGESTTLDPREGVRNRYAAIAEKANAGDFEPAIAEGAAAAVRLT